MRISGLEATISEMQRSTISPPPPVPSAADVVNQHVQQQLDLLKHNVSTLSSSGNALAENAVHVAKHVSSLVRRANQSDKFEEDTSNQLNAQRSQLGEILRLLTVTPVRPTDAPVGETQSRTPPTPIPTQTLSSPPRENPSPLRENPSPPRQNISSPKTNSPPPLSKKADEEAAARVETIKQLNEPQELLRAAVARQ